MKIVNIDLYWHISFFEFLKEKFPEARVSEPQILYYGGLDQEKKEDPYWCFNIDMMDQEDKGISLLIETLPKQWKDVFGENAFCVEFITCPVGEGVHFNVLKDCFDNEEFIQKMNTILKTVIPYGLSEDLGEIDGDEWLEELFIKTGIKEYAIKETEKV